MFKHHFFRTLFRQLKIIAKSRYWYIFFILFFNMIFAGLLPIIGVVIPRLIIQSFEATSNNELYMYILLYGLGSIVCAVMISISNAIYQPAVMHLRTIELAKVNKKLTSIDYKYLEDSNFIDWYTSATRGLNSNHIGFEGLYLNLFSLLPFTVTSVILFIILGKFSFLLLLAVIVGAVVSMFVILLAKIFHFKNKEKLAHLSRKVDYISEVSADFSYGKDIRIYNLIDKLLKDYDTRSYSYLSFYKRIKNKEFLVGLIEVAMLLLQDGLAYFLVIQGYFNGSLSLADMTLYLGSIIALSQALRNAGVSLGSLISNARYSNDYFKFMDDKKYVSIKGNHSRLEGPLEVEFRNVTFRYPNTEIDILKNFSFKINKNEKLAIVGLNGAGKTTIVKLICGLFMPNEGQILINGIDNKEFNQEEYFKMFGVVFQDINIFPATIYENIYGISGNKSRAEESISKVGLKDKIESLPKQYDTELLKVLFDDGTELSGGQSQKLAIARALYKDSNMVILDEPTATLDALAEASIYQDFDSLVQNKTAIYISHRLSSTKFCDHIALFSKDGLIEYGTHDELMKLKKNYYHMFSVQGKYYQEGGDYNEEY